MWTTLMLSAIFLGLFAGAEILYRYAKVPVEYTRKLVHIGSGLLTLLFPLLLDSNGQVLLLCVSFALILWISRRTGWLPSIHAIRRSSHGGICYPAAVYFIFLAYERMAAHGTGSMQALLYFYIPMLTMALCDPVAALVGRKWPVWKFRVGAGTKSLAGCTAFFGVAFLLTGALLNTFSSGYTPVQIIAVATVLSVATCATEAITPHGLDNLTIPIAAWGTLYSMNHLI